MKEESRVQGRDASVSEPESSLSDSGLGTLDSEAAVSHPQSVSHNPQSWQCLSISVPYEAAETVANFLVELGSEGVIEAERDLTQPASATTIVQGFFPLSRSQAELRAIVREQLQALHVHFPTLGSAELRFSEINSDAWSEHWRGHFPPLPVGQQFLVLPPWESQSIAPDRIALIIDPSMAFGTGHHATTQGCLEAIEMLCQQYGPPTRALDLGTGSGILAIALAKLGTTDVWATDNDPIALEEAHKNATTNHAIQHMHLSGTEVEMLPLPFPLIVANLFSSTLVTLASTLTAATASGGHAILSGIQLDQEAEVRAAYSAPTWQLVTRYPKDEWVTLVLQQFA